MWLYPTRMTAQLPALPCSQVALVYTLPPDVASLTIRCSFESVPLSLSGALLNKGRMVMRLSIQAIHMEA